MKTLLLAASLLLSTPALAAVPVADCWTTDGAKVGFNQSGEEIADGQWLVMVDPRKTSRDDLVWLLGAVARGNLRAVQYPIVMGTEHLVFVTEAQDDGSAYPKELSRPQLIERTSAQLAEISARNGVESIGCNGIAHPAE